MRIPFVSPRNEQNIAYLASVLLPDIPFRRQKPQTQSILARLYAMGGSFLYHLYGETRGVRGLDTITDDVGCVLEFIADAAKRGEHERLVLDVAPSGHPDYPIERYSIQLGVSH